MLLIRSSFGIILFSKRNFSVNSQLTKQYINPGIVSKYSKCVFWGDSLYSTVNSNMFIAKQRMAHFLQYLLDFFVWSCQHKIPIVIIGTAQNSVFLNASQ